MLLKGNSESDVSICKFSNLDYYGIQALNPLLSLAKIEDSCKNMIV
ncbi:hypothetical protein MC7420_5428 [Coleofasciculus chthonoplastes PCC 7420]|uniref:Uncharacterized protein n=1 Tax=Coleofasciculus chthonoplastes PCC 7420 TaxID=118168 RepID=B4VPT0_9CYAN|nr:hypothetical protein MC7420_5428 [Coleofasciculus chthonoplastes PCC 7420]